MILADLWYAPRSGELCTPNEKNDQQPNNKKQKGLHLWLQTLLLYVDSTQGIDYRIALRD